MSSFALEVHSCAEFVQFMTCINAKAILTATEDNKDMEHTMNNGNLKKLGLVASLILISIFASTHPSEAGRVAGNGPNPGTVNNVEYTEGLAVSPAPNTIVELVRIDGPGTFVSALMTKQEGASDITGVELLIDGEYVTADTIAALRNLGLTANNAYGVALFSTPSLNSVAIGFPYPLGFKQSLVLRANIAASDTGIVQIVGTVIHGH